LMPQMLLVLAMVLSLVACPFDCMGRMTAGEGGAARGCCCARCAENPVMPSEPTSDGPRCDCICYGAVLIDSVSLPFDPSSASAFAVVDVPVFVELARVDGAHPSAESAGLIRPGRSLHLALHSMQI
jgi:hypothetical protein